MQQIINKFNKTNNFNIALSFFSMQVVLKITANGGGMKSCRLRATYLSKYTKVY